MTVADRKNEYVFREGGEADFQELAEFLCRHQYGPKELNWSPAEYGDWLRWKYLANPDGPARIFIMEDLDKNIVGLRANLPRRFAGATTGAFRGYHGVDLLMDASLRGKGLYADFRDFVLAQLDLPSISFPRTFIFDAAVRRGRPAIGPMIKWWFPGALGQETAETPWEFVAPLADALSRLYAFCWLGTLQDDLAMEPVARFDKDFEMDTPFIHGLRSADYLNWRFIDNPMYEYSAYEFLENGEIVGYCVYTLVRSKAEMCDFVVARRQRGCLRLLIDHCHHRRIALLRFRGIGLHLKKFGFIPRRDSLNHCKGTPPVPQGPWLLTMADRDY